jgi:hypothetical protein
MTKFDEIGGGAVFGLQCWSGRIRSMQCNMQFQYQLCGMGSVSTTRRYSDPASRRAQFVSYRKTNRLVTFR